MGNDLPLLKFVVQVVGSNMLIVNVYKKMPSSKRGYLLCFTFHWHIRPTSEWSMGIKCLKTKFPFSLYSIELENVLPIDIVASKVRFVNSTWTVLECTTHACCRAMDHLKWRGWDIQNISDTDRFLTHPDYPTVICSDAVMDFSLYLLTISSDMALKHIILFALHVSSFIPPLIRI